MARPIFLEYKDAHYHIASRGINRQTLFHDAQDSNRFITILRKIVFQFNIRLYAFCLMTNHYHLYLSTPDSNLSKAIKSLNHRYAIYFLDRYKDKDGKVFKGRFMRRVVEEQIYSTNLIAYVHNNPYKLIEKVEDWEYSSYGSYIGLREKHDFIDYDYIFSKFSHDKNIFINFHRQMQKIEWRPECHSIAKTFIATEAFATKIFQKYLTPELTNNRELTGISFFKNKPDIPNLIEDIKSLRLSDKTTLQLEIFMLKEYYDISLKELSDRYGKSVKAISKIKQIFKKKLKQGSQHRELLENILNRRIGETCPHYSKVTTFNSDNSKL